MQSDFFLQFLENNLIHNAAVEAVILTVAFWALLFLVEKRKVAESLMERNLYESDPIRHPYAAAVMLIFTVALMTCIFATLDNVVTLGHAGGSMDVGRILRTFKIKKNVEVTDNGKIII